MKTTTKSMIRARKAVKFLDCATCPERADLNPDYKNMSWADLPCSKCKVPFDDRPDSHFAVLSSDYLDRIPPEGAIHGYEDRPLKAEQRADLTYKLLRATLKSETDRQLIQLLIEQPELTQEEMGSIVGISSRQIRRRLSALSHL